MSKERLSKQQRLIIDFIYKNGGELQQPKRSNSKIIYFHLLGVLGVVNKRSLSSSLSRSLNNLRDKGLIECTYFYYGGGLARCRLTSKGYHVQNLAHDNNKNIETKS